MKSCLTAILLTILLVNLRGSLCQHTFCSYKDVPSGGGANKYNGPKPSDDKAGHTQPPGGVQDVALSHVSRDVMENGEVFLENSTMKCKEDKHLCFAVWRTDPNDKTKMEILKQGCWEHVKCSKVPICAPHRPHPNNTLFCCCYGDYCNQNITNELDPSYMESSTPVVTPEYRILPDPNYRERTIIIALVSVFLVAFLIVIVYLTYRLRWAAEKPRPDPSASVNLMEGGKVPDLPTFELDQLKLCDLLQRGRYGEVWRATLNEHEVAVKLYAPHHRGYYVNERDIYVMPRMDHPSLLKFLGAEERIEPEGGFSFVIVLQYQPLGSLTHYLRHNTVDWATLCGMLLSIANGISHLHTEFLAEDKTKVAVAHRDLNTKNILVKEDLTCCICDFGFAMRIAGAMFIRNGIEENAEQASLADVGTLRYMAPEVLEGAVNLRDCEASLKQVDIYAIGLIYWEIGSRCTELYQGMPVPDYKLPFQEEIGVHPTFEDMQNLVSRNKTRPKFPAVWKDTNHAVRAFKETIEDCWDQDAEARLTALCVEERILDIVSLWDVRNKGVTPTINPMPQLVNLSNDQSVFVNATTGNGNSGTNTVTDSNGHRIDEHAATLPRPSRLSSTDHSVSASTTDTTLTGSPSEYSAPSEFNTRPPGGKNNVNLVFANTHKVLQPHQGQNPTVERNTHKRSDEELAIMGNSLVDKNKSSAPSMNFPDNLMDVFRGRDNSLESSLVQNDLLNQQEVSPPQASVAPPPVVRQLPPNYFQNQVHNNPPPGPQQHPSQQQTQNQQQHQNQQPMVVRPKQPNVPPNSNATTVLQSPQSRSKVNGKKPKEGKMAKLGNIFGRNPFWKNSHSSYQGVDNKNYFPTENLREPAPAPQLAMMKQAHQRNISDGAPSSGPYENKSNLEPRPLSSSQVPTEVCLMNGAPVVRPTSLPITQAAHPKLGPPPPYPRDARENGHRAAEQEDSSSEGAVGTSAPVRPPSQNSSQKTSSTSSLSSNSCPPPLGAALVGTAAAQGGSHDEVGAISNCVAPPPSQLAPPPQAPPKLAPPLLHPQNQHIPRPHPSSTASLPMTHNNVTKEDSNHNMLLNSAANTTANSSLTSAGHAPSHNNNNSTESEDEQDTANDSVFDHGKRMNYQSGRDVSECDPLVDHSCISMRQLNNVHDDTYRC